MADIAYPRPIGRRKYNSSKKHFRNANNSHSKWLSVGVERTTFDNADYGNFSHDNTGIAWLDGSVLWGFLRNQEVVGTSGEQFGFFIGQTNASLEWHGYPVIPFSLPRLNISTTLIERWVVEGVLDRDDVPSLLKQRRI